MKKLLTFAAFSTAILCSCGQQASQQAETAVPAESTVEATAGINELTAQEKAEGWQLLFDGKTTKGWRGAHKETFPDKGWEIKDGVLTVLPADGGESTNGGDIVTEGVYSAFELSVDFQITPGANSGIKYFVTEQEKQKGSAYGLEFQILDDALHPDAKLYINEYGAEFMGRTKTEAYYNLIKRLQKSNVPIDGCGLQCHLTTGELDSLNLEKNIQRYAELGLNCIITELDIAYANPFAADAAEVQALEYGAVARIWLRNANCPSLLVWGIADHFSWRQNQPLLYDANLSAKPAYYNIHAQLRKEVERVQTGIKGMTDNDSAVVKTELYNLAGQRITTKKGIVIERKYFANGSVKTTKMAIR